MSLVALYSYMPRIKDETEVRPTVHLKATNSHARDHARAVSVSSCRGSRWRASNSAHVESLLKGAAMHARGCRYARRSDCMKACGFDRMLVLVRP
eukprot:6139068-Pleurochrysis_carterae.AAC.1